MSEECERPEDSARRFAREVIQLQQENARLDARLHEARLAVALLVAMYVLALAYWAFA